MFMKYLVRSQFKTDNMAPDNGPTQYTQWLDHDQEMAVGPNERAGFMDPPETGAPIKIPTAMAVPIDTAEILPRRFW